MIEQLESALPIRAFGASVSSLPIEATRRSPELSLAKPATRHSVTAAAFLALYVAVYLTIGFLGISLIGRAWAAVFE
jgi:hypothetical protein